MEVNTYIGFWTLKMKCIPYGLYEPSTLNPKSTLFRSTFSDMTRYGCARQDQSCRTTKNSSTDGTKLSSTLSTGAKKAGSWNRPSCPMSPKLLNFKQILPGSGPTSYGGWGVINVSRDEGSSMMMVLERIREGCIRQYWLSSWKWLGIRKAVVKPRESTTFSTCACNHIVKEIK